MGKSCNSTKALVLTGRLHDEPLGGIMTMSDSRFRGEAIEMILPSVISEVS